MSRKTIRIAVQKKGRLREPSLSFLNSLGLQFSTENDRSLLEPCRNAAVEILYVRHSDIPQYVESGAADFAIVGGNILSEQERKVRPLRSLEFGKCRLVIAVPVPSDFTTIADLEGERIATSYPNSLRAFLRQQRINASIIEIAGSVEVAPALDLSDAICDLVQTGKTLEENSLKPVVTLLESSAVLIESVTESAQKSDFKDRFLTPLP